MTGTPATHWPDTSGQQSSQCGLFVIQLDVANETDSSSVDSVSPLAQPMLELPENGVLSPFRGALLTVVHTMLQLDHTTTPEECCVQVGGVTIRIVLLYHTPCCLALYAPCLAVSASELRSMTRDLYDVLTSQWPSFHCGVVDTVLFSLCQQLMSRLSASVNGSRYCSGSGNGSGNGKCNGSCSGSGSSNGSYRPYVQCGSKLGTVTCSCRHGLSLDSQLEEDIMLCVRGVECTALSLYCDSETSCCGDSALVGDIIGAALYTLGCLVISHLSHGDTHNISAYLRMTGRLDGSGGGGGGGGGGGAGAGGGGAGGGGGEVECQVEWRPYYVKSTTAAEHQFIVLLYFNESILATLVHIFERVDDSAGWLGDAAARAVRHTLFRHPLLFDLTSQIVRQAAVWREESCDILPMNTIGNRNCKTTVGQPSVSRSGQQIEKSHKFDQSSGKSPIFWHSRSSSSNVFVFSEPGCGYTGRSLLLIEAVAGDIIAQLQTTDGQQRTELGAVVTLSDEEQQPTVWIIARRVDSDQSGSPPEPADASGADSSCQLPQPPQQSPSGRILCVCLTEQMSVSDVDEAFWHAADLKT